MTTDNESENVALAVPEPNAETARVAEPVELPPELCLEIMGWKKTFLEFIIPNRGCLELGLPVLLQDLKFESFRKATSWGGREKHPIRQSFLEDGLGINKFAHVKTLEMRADASPFFVELLAKVAPTLLELRVAIEKDVRADAELSKAFSGLNVLGKLSIDCLNVLDESPHISYTSQKEAGATVYEPLLKTAASLESLQEFALVCSDPDSPFGRTETYSSWPAVLIKYPPIAHKLTSAYVTDEELAEWVGIELPLLRKVKISDDHANEFQQWREIDVFPGLRKLTAHRMPSGDLLHFPLRDLKELRLELCSLSVGTSNLASIRKKVAATQCRIVLAPDEEQLEDSDAWEHWGNETRFWEKLGVEVERSPGLFDI
jgi:hypothetical protein